MRSYNRYAPMKDPPIAPITCPAVILAVSWTVLAPRSIVSSVELCGLEWVRLASGYTNVMCNDGSRATKRRPCLARNIIAGHAVGGSNNRVLRHTTGTDDPAWRCARLCKQNKGFVARQGTRSFCHRTLSDPCPWFNHPQYPTLDIPLALMELYLCYDVTCLSVLR